MITSGNTYFSAGLGYLRVQIPVLIDRFWSIEICLERLRGADAENAEGAMSGRGGGKGMAVEGIDQRTSAH